MSEKVLYFLNAQKTASQSGVNHYYAKFEDYYDRKLWHQLTKSIESFISEGSFSQGDELLQLYWNFITDFETKINELSLAQFTLAASKQFKDPKESITFLQSIAEKLAASTGPSVMLTMEAAAFQLATGDTLACKQAIEKCEKLLESLPGVETVIHASFYRVSSSFDQARGNYDGFYKNSLLYLACVPLQTLSVEEKIQRTYNLGLAALLGTSIYNFGELMAHDILSVLDGTQHEWLVRTLQVFNSGDIHGFDSLLPSLQNEPLLSKNMIFLEQKIRLMCLIEIIFNLSGDSRNLSFEKIAESTRLPEDHVENLLIKAMSLKLIKGVIDEVDQVVYINWVQPRVLNKAQIAALKNRLESWSASVAKTAQIMHDETPDLFVQ